MKSWLGGQRIRHPEDFGISCTAEILTTIRTPLYCNEHQPVIVITSCHQHDLESYAFVRNEMYRPPMSQRRCEADSRVTLISELPELEDMGSKYPED